MRNIFFFLALILSVSASCQTAEVNDLYVGQNLNTDQVLTKIALGSCNRQDKPQDMWQWIVAENPQLWIWMGDNIYGDTEDMNVMIRKYRKQKSNADYQKLRAKAGVIGIWDDHDYGVNDGDKNFPKKDETKALMLDFLDVPADAEVRSRPGAYQSYTFGPEGKQVKIILLDGRYFRDELIKDGAKRARYIPNEKGDILGKAQWKWLKGELKNSEAQIHLIACGIQFIPEEQVYEKWANFPAARKKLFKLLEKTQPANAVLLSGDRHISELSKIELDKLDYPVYELTSSGLTHTWSLGGTEPNKYREGDLIVALNYGILSIDWSGAQPQLSVEVKGLENKTLLEQKLKW
ncbi:MAG: alkaline phosphatase D family protein [Bacteroidota bacterium]